MHSISDPHQERRVGRELHRLNNRISRHMEGKHACWQHLEITASNVRIICYLFDHQHQDIYQKDLESAFEITRSTASKVLRLMEQKGLIRRLSVSQDARLKKLELTDCARGLHEQLRHSADEMDRNLLRGFSPKEERQLISYLDRMLQNLDCLNDTQEGKNQ